MSSLDLHPKVAASLLGSWVATIVLYVLRRYVDADLPVEVGAAIVSVVTFVCGWLAPLKRAPAVVDAPAAAAAVLPPAAPTADAEPAVAE